MYLKDLIAVLEKADQSKVCRKGFNNPHSWRGSYDELAFEPAENVTVGEMLRDARAALGATYEGYKGGEFAMGEWTEVHISNFGSSHDFMGEMLLDYMLEPTHDHAGYAEPEAAGAADQAQAHEGGEEGAEACKGAPS